MDIQVVAEVYGGLPERVVTRAREVLRLARAKSSIQVDMAMPVACLVVACRALDEPIDVKKMASLLRISARGLDQAARKIANVVNVKSLQKLTPSTLCVRYGCATITEQVNRVYDEYQVVAHRLARGKGGGMRTFDPTDPVFAAACLFACAKRARLRVDRPKLLADISANARMFESIVTSIESTCQKSLAGPAGVSRAARTAAATAPPTSHATATTGKSHLVMTKAAQRAALVLERAVTEKEAKEKEAKAALSNKPTVKKKPDTGVTKKEYAAWRSKVLVLRRKMATEGHDADAVKLEEPSTRLDPASSSDKWVSPRHSESSRSMYTITNLGDANVVHSLVDGAGVCAAER